MNASGVLGGELEVSRTTEPARLVWSLPGFSSMTITHSHKLLTLVVSMGVLVGACVDQQDSSSVQESAVRTSAIATIANMLPVDGCSYPVTINGVDYAPDARSLDAIRDLVPAGGTIKVRINYRLTGRTGRVECGFGTSRELPEIAFRVQRILDNDAGDPASGDLIRAPAARAS